MRLIFRHHSMQARQRLLQRIAQQLKTPNLSGSPTNVETILDYNPTVVIGWSSKNVALIHRIIDILNWSIFIMSTGELDFESFRRTFFSEIDNVKDAVLLSIVRFSSLVYREILAPQFKTELTPEEKAIKIAMLMKAIPSILQISNNEVGGLLKTKIGGNLKENLMGILPMIK